MRKIQFRSSFHFNYVRDLTKRRKLFSILVAEYASFSYQARTLKTNLLCLISNFSKYYFKTSSICFLFLSSHVITALEFNCNHFGTLLWKIVKPPDHNEIEPPIRKIFRKYKLIIHYLVISWKQLSCSFTNKVCDNYNKVSHFQRNKKCYNLETTFQKNVNFSQYIRFIRSYYLTIFQTSVAVTLNVSFSWDSVLFQKWNPFKSFMNLPIIHTK